MPEGHVVPMTTLEAGSPYELRVNLGKGVAQETVRSALTNGDMGFLHSFTTGATVDGPGVRIVAWTAGCMWRCRYCHNPDTWSMSNGIPVSITAAVDELRKYRHGLRAMSGGLTLSGGEPLMQDRFAIKLFSAAKGLGIHTALDTNGFYGERLNDRDLDQVDLVMLDMKAWSPQRHKHVTGMDKGPTVAFARRLAARRHPVWLRYVLVPGLTDDLDDISNLARFASLQGNVERVDVLPFHQMGKYKWARLNMAYTLADTQPPAPDLVERVVGIFRGEGLTAW